MGHKFLPEKKVGHLKIKYFNKKTYQETKVALADMKKKKVSSCILDLRSNNGGLFDEGVKTLKLFAKKNSKLLKIKRPSGKFDLVKAETNGQTVGCKWVVLIDKDTKSMGEAFTSSFRSLKNATVIGERTFGKASMETILVLDNGHSIKYTIGQLYDINGKTWAGTGVTPDILISSSNQEDVLIPTT